MGIQQQWTATASSNSGADPLVNVAENQAPSTVNDAMRSIMAQIKKTVGDIAGGLVTTGSATAFAVDSNEVITALSDGMTVRARAHTASGAAPTLALDGTGAKSIKLAVGVTPHVGAILSGGVYTFTYYASTDCWLLSGGPVVGKFVGESFEWNSDTAPPWSLLCYGQAISRTTYAALFAVIGTTFGPGDGSATFNLPDDRGRVTAGQDDMGGVSANRLTGQTGGVDGDVLGGTGGSETHQLTLAQMAAHGHGVGTLDMTTDGAHTHAWGSNNPLDAGGGGSASAAGGSSSFSTSSAGSHKHTLSGSTASVGNDTAHNNVQPTIIRNKCIFAGV